MSVKRKTLKVYAVHSWVKDVDSFLSFLNIEPLKDEFDFVWADSYSPDYLIATDQIYSSKAIFRRFKKNYREDAINIFIASEAIAPDFNVFDYCVGWDSNMQIGDRYCLLPPAYVYPGRKFIKGIVNTLTTQEQAREELRKKTGFCNFLYSNWVAHPMRDRLFYELSKYKKVDSLGKHLNNVGRKGTGYIGHRMECIDIKRPYKFSIASENATFPGYTSEKIWTSFNAHTVPIYWGDPDIGKFYNEKAFINAMKFDSINALMQRVKEIDDDDEKWCEMVSLPWQTAEQVRLSQDREQEYLNFFRHIFSQEYKYAHRASSGTMPDVYKYHFFNGFRSKWSEYFRVLKHKIEIQKIRK